MMQNEVVILREIKFNSIMKQIPQINLLSLEDLTIDSARGMRMDFPAISGKYFFLPPAPVK